MKRKVQPNNLVVGGESFVIKTLEIQSFFDIMKDQFDCQNLSDILLELENIKDDILASFPDEKIAKDLKKRLMMIQEIQFLFKAMLVSDSIIE